MWFSHAPLVQRHLLHAQTQIKHLDYFNYKKLYYLITSLTHFLCIWKKCWVWKYWVSSFCLQALIYLMAIIIRVHSAIKRNYYLFMSKIYMSKTSTNQYNSNNITIYFQKIQKILSFPFFKNKNFISIYFFTTISLYIYFSMALINHHDQGNLKGII